MDEPYGNCAGDTAVLLTLFLFVAPAPFSTSFADRILSQARLKDLEDENERLTAAAVEASAVADQAAADALAVADQAAAAADVEKANAVRSRVANLRVCVR